MRNFCSSFILLFMLVSSFSVTGFSLRGVRAVDDNPVHNVSSGIDYSTIQSAIDAQETLDGHTINVDSGTYVENVVVSKSVYLEGAERNSTIIDGNMSIAPAIRVAANNVMIRGFTAKNATTGILVDKVNNTLIAENNAIENVDLGKDFHEIAQGILVRYSGNCILRDNVVADNGNSGILITNSWNFTAEGNFVYNNKLSHGLDVNASSYGIIRENYVLSSRFDGIGLANGATDCLVEGNTVRNSTLGIWIDGGSANNVIYHNNFFFNLTQAAITPGIAAQWDNGIEGNYWTDYTGSDFNNDGIGDTPVVKDSLNFDNYPLMGPFSQHIPYKNYSVNLVSNSAISDMAFFKTNSTMKMRVANMTTIQTNGFCRIKIPHALMIQPYSVTVDGAQPNYANYSIFSDGSNSWLYFIYSHSLREVMILGAASPDVDPPIIDILSPRNRQYKTDSIELDFTTDEEPAWIGYSLDGQANITIQQNTTLSGMPSAVHNVIVFANDTAGNMGFSQTIVFTISQPQLSMWLILGIVSAAIAIAIIVVIATVYLRRRKKATPKT